MGGHDLSDIGLEIKTGHVQNVRQISHFILPFAYLEVMGTWWMRIVIGLSCLHTCMMCALYSRGNEIAQMLCVLYQGR